MGFKKDKFHGKIKKETEKAILCGSSWIPKSAIARKEQIIKEDDWPIKEGKEEYFIQTRFPLSVSGWIGGEIKLELKSGELVYVSG
jgi:hypothetical protein